VPFGAGIPALRSASAKQTALRSVRFVVQKNSSVGPRTVETLTLTNVLVVRSGGTLRDGNAADAEKLDFDFQSLEWNIADVEPSGTIVGSGTTLTWDRAANAGTLTPADTGSTVLAVNPPSTATALRVASINDNVVGPGNKIGATVVATTSAASLAHMFALLQQTPTPLLTTEVFDRGSGTSLLAASEKYANAKFTSVTLGPLQETVAWEAPTVTMSVLSYRQDGTLSHTDAATYP
jgi:hypothetical protein